MKNRQLLDRIASIYRSATVTVRTQMLEQMLRPVGPLALVALAAGAFGEVLRRGHYRRLVVLPEDALRITTEQLVELARYLDQHSPETLRGITHLWTDPAAAAPVV